MYYFVCFSKFSRILFIGSVDVLSVAAIKRAVRHEPREQTLLCSTECWRCVARHVFTVKSCLANNVTVPRQLAGNVTPPISETLNDTLWTFVLRSTASR